MPTSKRPASVRPIPPLKKKPRLSNTTSKNNKPTPPRKQTQVVDHSDSVSQEELLDEEDQDARPSAGHALGPLDGNTLSIKTRSITYSFVACQ
jgi:hypothetical protein